MAHEIRGYGENHPEDAKSHGFLILEDGKKGGALAWVPAVDYGDKEEESQEEIIHWTEQFASF